MSSPIAKMNSLKQIHMRYAQVSSLKHNLENVVQKPIAKSSRAARFEGKDA